MTPVLLVWLLIVVAAALVAVGARAGRPHRWHTGAGLALAVVVAAGLAHGLTAPGQDERAPEAVVTSAG